MCLLYISIIGPLLRGKEIDMEKDMPGIIPIMAFAGVIIFISGVLAMWPIWGFLTPIYFIVIFFGSTLSTIFLPGGQLGNLCFWILFIGAGYIAHTMPHEAEW